MLLPMLKALAEILEGDPSKDTIGCAKKVLKEIINHLEVDANKRPHLFSEAYSSVSIDPNLSPEANQAKDELLGNQED